MFSPRALRRQLRFLYRSPSSGVSTDDDGDDLPLNGERPVCVTRTTQYAPRRSSGGSFIDRRDARRVLGDERGRGGGLAVRRYGEMIEGAVRRTLISRSVGCQVVPRGRAVPSSERRFGALANRDSDAERCISCNQPLYLWARRGAARGCTREGAWVGERTSARTVPRDDRTERVRARAARPSGRCGRRRAVAVSC
jgi:hypothetical protein